MGLQHLVEGPGEEEEEPAKEMMRSREEKTQAGECGSSPTREARKANTSRNMARSIDGVDSIMHRIALTAIMHRIALFNLRGCR